MWRLAWRPRIRLVLAALGASAGTIGVIESVPLARLLAEAGRPVVLFATQARPLRRWRGAGARAAAGALPVSEGALGGLVATGAAAEARFAEWTRVLRDGGALVLLDRAAPEELSRRALCAGLTELEQRRRGGLVVTSGRTRLLRAAPASSR